MRDAVVRSDAPITGFWALIWARSGFINFFKYTQEKKNLPFLGNTSHISVFELRSSSSPHHRIDASSLVWCWASMAISDLLREGNRLYSYHLSRVQSQPPNYTTYYLTLTEPMSQKLVACSRKWNINLLWLKFYRGKKYRHMNILSLCLMLMIAFKHLLWLGSMIASLEITIGWLSCLLGKDSRLYS